MFEGFELYLALFIFVDLLVIFYVVRKRLSDSLSQSEKNFIKSEWKRIEELFHVFPRQAVVEADKLLDHTMKKVTKFNGTLGENLKRNATRFKNLNDVWFAHKLRNRLVHELNFEPVFRDYAKAKQGFKRALNDLGLKL